MLFVLLTLLVSLRFTKVVHFVHENGSLRSRKWFVSLTKVVSLRSRKWFHVIYVEDHSRFSHFRRRSLTSPKATTFRAFGTQSIQLSSEGLLRNWIKRSLSSGAMYAFSAATSTRVSRSHRLTFFTSAAAKRSRPFFMP